MKTFYSQREKNIRNTWILLTFFFSLILGVGWFLSYYYNDVIILWIAFFISLVSNFWAYFFSHKMVLSIANAREAPIEEYKELHRIVENIAITAGIPKPKIYIIQDQSPNAFATGRNAKHGVVAVTTGLLSLMNKNELEGVIAHEISHIRNEDILISTIAVVLTGILSLLARIFVHGFSSKNSRREGNSFIGILGFIFIVIILPLISLLLRLAISRKREYLADASAVMLTRYPKGLASALEKIKSYHGEVKLKQHAIAHLFIADPERDFSLNFNSSSRKAKTFLKNLFMTHPPIEERIRILREMEGA